MQKYYIEEEVNFNEKFIIEANSLEEAKKIAACKMQLPRHSTITSKGFLQAGIAQKCSKCNQYYADKEKHQCTEETENDKVVSMNSKRR